MTDKTDILHDIATHIVDSHTFFQGASAVFLDIDNPDGKAYKKEFEDVFEGEMLYYDDEDEYISAIKDVIDVFIMYINSKISKELFLLIMMGSCASYSSSLIEDIEMYFDPNKSEEELLMLRMAL